MLKGTLERSILLAAAAALVLSLGAPQLPAQATNCCDRSNLMTLVCHKDTVPPCDEMLRWVTCRYNRWGYVSEQEIDYCCEQAVGTWWFDMQHHCGVAAPPQATTRGNIRIRPFYARACDGDYVLIDPNEKS